MSLTIGKVFGIPVRLHFTLLLLLIVTLHWVSPTGLFGMLGLLTLVALMAGSVLLHELGHALVARRFGIETHDIVLTPIGGMARVVSLPKVPRHEILIAIAGPLVSIAIAVISFVLWFSTALLAIGIPGGVQETLLNLCGFNVMLGIFNLVPALPMDGGRVLRGVLALRRDYLTATLIAARVGRTLAVIGGITAIYIGHWPLGLISVFIYFAAGTEVRMAQMRAYQERMQGSPFPGGAGAPEGNVWTWSWRSGRDYPNAAPPKASPTQGDWSKRDPSDREVLTISGKAEVISRKDPDSKD